MQTLRGHGLRSSTAAPGWPPSLLTEIFLILASMVEFMVMHPGLFTVAVKGHPEKGHHMPTCPFLATISGEVQCHRLDFVQNSEIEKITSPLLSCCGEMAILQILEGENDENTDTRHNFQLPLVDANLNVPSTPACASFPQRESNSSRRLALRAIAQGHMRVYAKRMVWNARKEDTCIKECGWKATERRLLPTQS